MIKKHILELTSGVITCLEHGLRKYSIASNKPGFLYTPCPRIVPVSGACENVDSLFIIKEPVSQQLKSDSVWWGGQRAFFAQTAQLHLERLLHEHPCLYVHGSSGRAEERVDGRHLSEFELFELEMVGGFNDLVNLIHIAFGSITTYLPSYVTLTKQEKERIVLLSNITNLRYTDAIHKLNENGVSINYGDDLHSQAELKLCEVYGGPVLVTHFPNNQHPEQDNIEVEKFFNMRPCKSDREVLSCDLILPIAGESLGGAERIWEEDILRKRLEGSRMYSLMVKNGLSMKDFETYLGDMKANGPATGAHAGCGIGIPRVVQYILGVSSIEDAVAFVSTKNKLV